MEAQSVLGPPVLGLELEAWFSVAGSLAMLGWAILILAPRRWPVLNAVPAYILPAVLSAGYAVLILLFFGEGEGGFDSLQAVARLFEQAPLLLAGWVHYLAFDLFIGAWIARRADVMGMHRVLQAPILLATFMLGPIGLLVFLTVHAGRAGAGRSTLAVEEGVR